jgi:hypothetical protein
VTQTTLKKYSPNKVFTGWEILDSEGNHVGLVKRVNENKTKSAWIAEVPVELKTRNGIPANQNSDFFPTKEVARSAVEDLLRNAA